MATPNPSNVSPWYLRNINQALALDTVSGNVFIRTNAQVLGNVTVGNVGVTSLGNVNVSGNTLPVSGNVNITALPEVEIKNDVGNPIPVTANYNTLTVGFNPVQTDAFGRFRVSNPFTLFDSFHRYQDNGKISSYTANGGTISYDSSAGTVLMNVTTASGSTVYRESTKVFAYQPGKSLLVMQTFVLAPPQTNLTQRFGYFDVNNGFYLQRVGNQISFVKRSSSSGATVNTVINQASWNVDPMDGNGPSGINLDFTKAQIMWHDIEWLGVGSVRSGFVVNGKFYVAHIWYHANIVTTTYMTTACLPVRSEIFTTAATASPATLTVICTSIQSEGGYQLTGRPISAGHTLGTPVRLPNDSSFKPIMSIRLKSDRLNGIVVPNNFTIAPVAQAVFKYQIYTGAITTGGTWTSAGTNSCVEYNLAPTGLTSGNPSDTGFIVSSNQSTAAPSLAETPFQYQLERNSFTNTAYEFVIMAASTGTNQDVYASIGWEEIT